MTGVGDLVSHDQVMLGIDGGLDVVADRAAPTPARRHRARVQVGQRDLLAWRGVHDRFKGFERRHLLAKRGDLLPQADRLGLRQFALLAISCLQGCHVALDAGFDLVHPLLQLGLGEVLVPGIHSLELAAIDRRHGVAEQVQSPAQIDKPAADDP